MSKNEFLAAALEAGCLRVHQKLADTLRQRLGIDPIRIDDISSVLLPEDIEVWNSALRSGSYEAVALIA